MTVRGADDLKHGSRGHGHKPRRVTQASIIALFNTFAHEFPRLAVLDGQGLQLRDFPQDHSAQDKMHNEMVRGTRLTLREAPQARVKWMSRSGAKRDNAAMEVPGAASDSASAAPCSAAAAD